MAQADSSTITSRRKFLAGAVAASAILAPNVAVPAPAGDAKLLELGRELSELTQEYYVEVARLRPFQDAHRRLMDDWNAAHPVIRPGEALAAYERFCGECGLEAAEAVGHPDDVMNRIDPISRAIMTIPATTLAGVVVKAQLARFAANEIWEGSVDDLDWDKEAMRRLCDAVIELA